MKVDGIHKNKFIIPRLTILRFVMLVSILVSILMLTTSSHALDNEDIKWSDEGNTYRLTRTDNIFTEKEYTVEAVEFPSAVRGYKAIDGSMSTERPVSPFVKF